MDVLSVAASSAVGCCVLGGRTAIDPAVIFWPLLLSFTHALSRTHWKIVMSVKCAVSTVVLHGLFDIGRADRCSQHLSSRRA